MMNLIFEKPGIILQIDKPGMDQNQYKAIRFQRILENIKSYIKH